MSDLLSVGRAGVLAYQAALAVTGDNVANADTEGYSRRTVTLTAGPVGSGAILSRDALTGSGVLATGIARAGDALKTNSARVADGDHARFAIRADWLTRMQDSVTASELDARLGGFFDAATDLAAAPTSSAARTIFLERADQAATGFRGLGEDLAAQASDIETATRITSDEVNAITSALARVNEELRRTQPNGTAANGLLDSRDQLLADLAERVRISVTEGPRGAVTVRLGTGGAAAIIVPEFGSATRIGARDGASGPELILDPTHTATVMRLPASGSLAGLLEAGRQLGELRTEVDALASRFASAVNAWHAQGSDALGDPGQPLFATQGLAITPGKANAGVAPIDVTIADSAPLAAGGYTLIYDATGFTLARADGTASVTGAGPLLLDGVTIRPGAGARPGDGWQLAITSGATGLSLRPIGPERVAVAAPFLSDAASGNLGDARLVLDADPAAAAFPPAPPYRLTITAPGIAELTDIATGTVLATATLDGSRIIGAGFGFTLEGTPETGDSFRILATAPGSSDNANIRGLAKVRGLIGPGGTLEASLDASTAGLGARLAETDRLAATALAVKTDAARAADAVSGIDLDKEAAELTRLQVAYRANAQVIAAARDLFDTILGIAR